MSPEAGDGDRRPATKPQQKQPEPESLACPRCESTKTKFCYYNNYNLSQPRYFCKSCRRYWTRGGTLRNVPVGGGSRKTPTTSTSKRHRSSAVNTTASSENEPSFTSLLTAANNTTTPGGGAFMGLAGYGLGLGLGLGSSVFAEMDFEYGASMAAENNGGGSSSSGCDTWQLAGALDGDGSVVDGWDYFTWPDLAMSTATTKGLE